jgi:small subunit ribosomal protein S4e
MRLKRLAAPGFWPIEKKIKKFVVSPSPGPHPKKASIPVAIIIRDILGYAQTIKEVKTIMNQGLVKVDGRVKKDYAYPIGLMDIVTIGDECFMIVPSIKGFELVSLKKEDSAAKLCRIKDKKCIGNKIQLNLHDGKNILIDKKDGNKYSTGDVLILDTEKNSIKENLKFEKGATALIISGHNVGALGKIEDIVVTRSSQPNQVIIDIENRKVPMPKDCVFVVGKEKPVIPIGESK